jgi:PII-like signaling protein
MNDLTAVRLYFPIGARAKATRFWHHLSAPALGHHLLRAAHRARIQQAVMHPVSAGYLSGDRLSYQSVEATHLRLPQCIELIDTEGRLRRFLHDHAEEIEKVQVVLYRCEFPLAQTKPSHAEA